ncbi:UNVERIFIED_CONTAM: hypothetical protein GTU68_052112, partial [Idotea baltica]|nr:hypothetical protein [Idotea baltica]
SYNIAINGYGRIGRCILRALYERRSTCLLEPVAINDLMSPDHIEYLTRFDSTHGLFPAEIALNNKTLLINNKAIQLFSAESPELIDWQSFSCDLLLECSGKFVDRKQGEHFLQAGAPRILFSQPLSDQNQVDKTIIYGINQATINRNDQLVSSGSCSTNCAVPLVKILDDVLGLEQLSITTIHSAMHDQPVLDAFHHQDLRKNRSATQSLVPVDTGLARGIERLLPHLAGRIQAKSIRAPVINVSCLDMTFWTKTATNEEGVNQLLSNFSKSDEWSGILAYTERLQVSCDFNHNPHSAIIDGTQTQVTGGRMISILAWFDNEWGFANRMLDVAEYWLDNFK